MKKHTGTVLIYLAGLLLIIFGIAAGFIPFVPGVVFILIGVYVISLRSLWLKGKLGLYRVRHPRFNVAIMTLENQAVRIWGRVVNFFRKK